MREIKFRVWNIISKTMRSFSEIKRCADFAMADGLNSNDFIVLPLKNSILNQFTGMLDKNGVEIYEGDVVKAYDVDYCSEIAFLFGEWHAKQYGDCLFGSNHYFEVIGNIYEHSYLLEANHD